MAKVMCTYCKKPCDGTKHDTYGEHVLKRTDLAVCDECDDDLAHEPGPWNMATD